MQHKARMQATGDKESLTIDIYLSIDTSTQMVYL